MPQIIIPGPAGAEGRGARAPAGARAQAAADRRAAGAALKRRVCAAPNAFVIEPCVCGLRAMGAAGGCPSKSMRHKIALLWVPAERILFAKKYLKDSPRPSPRILKYACIGYPPDPNLKRDRTPKQKKRLSLTNLQTFGNYV